MKSKVFFKYAGIIMMAGGLIWFYYLDMSAEARLKQSQQDIYRMIDKKQWNHGDATRDRIAMNFLIRESADEIQYMIYPFLLTLNGCLFMLIHERKKAGKASPVQPAAPAKPEGQAKPKPEELPE